MGENEEKDEKDEKDEAQKGSDSGEMEDISWEDAAADLETQRDMLKDAAAEGEEDPASAYPVAPESGGEVTDASQPIPENVGRILDLPLKVTVELGRTKMLINDLLQLGQGSVIELSKLVGETLEVLVNGKRIAKGEVVVVNEKFGVRLTEISTPTERIESMK